MKKINTFLFGCLLVVGSVTSAIAIDMNTTEITKIKGTVKVKKTSSPVFKKLRKRLKLSGSLKRLSGGDKVNTRSKSSADMVLKETCVLVVKEQSMFEVPSKLGKDNLQELKAQQGSLLFKVISGSNFEVRTADVIAGVKGTLFEVDVIDNLNSMLETPNLEIGTLAAGGTTVNVYEGKVELRHVKTGEVKILHAGEGISAFNDVFRKVDQTLQKGFGLIRKFNPANVVREKFGQAGDSLYKAAPVLTDIQEITGMTYPSSIGNASSRMDELCSGLSAPLVQKLRKAQVMTNQAGRVVSEAKEIQSIFKGLAGEKFKPNFSKYRQIKSNVSVSSNRTKEIYLGNLTFAGVTAGFGSRKLKLEPTAEGIAVTDGFGGFKVKKFNGRHTVAEFRASYYMADNKLVTTIKVNKGELYGRIPGNLEVFRIPKGLNSFVYDVKTGRSAWTASKRGAILKSTRKYKFKVDAALAKQKARINRKNSKRRTNSLKKLIRKRPRKLLKRFGF